MLGYTLIQFVTLLLLPYGITMGAKALKLEGWLSPVVLCYLAGIAIGNFKLFPLNQEVNLIAQQATVTIAIPLLLISTNIPVWLRQAKTTTASYVIAVIGVILASVITFFIFPGKSQEGWMISAMLAGALTGSALNMNAVGMAFEVPEEIIGLVNLSDIINGGIYLIFLTSIAQKVLGRFLPAYKSSGDYIEEPKRDLYGSKKGYVGKAGIYLKAFGISVVIVALSVGGSMLLKGEIHEAITILLLTVFSVSGSFFKKLRNQTGAYELGQYLLLVFCIAIGMEADFRTILSSSPDVFAYSATLFLFSISFHFIGARIFKIDVDTTLITSTAAIFGPPFIPQVAMALRNREVIFSGIITALAGYAIGNFIGIGIGYLIRNLIGL